MIDTFIKNHLNTYINYCEALILPDGEISYAVPSHVYALQKLWGIPENELYDISTPKQQELALKMPLTASPLHWLCEDLNIVSVWYNQLVFPLTYTAKQLSSVKKLISSGCISKNLDISVTVEKSITAEGISVSEINELIKTKQQVYDDLKSLLFNRKE